MDLLEKFSQLKRLVNGAAADRLKPLGVGVRQAAILHQLQKLGKSSLADLSRATSSDPAVTGRVTDVLIRKGWVAQREHPHDRRQWVVFLTPSGKRLAKRVHAVFEDLSGNLLLSLSSGEREQLIALFNKLLANS